MSFDKLRDESIAFQDHQLRLLLWKIVSIGTVAALGLGIGNIARPNAWILSIAPFIAIYADLVLRQLDLRIAIIGKYLRDHPAEDLAAYEISIESEKFSTIHAWRFNEVALVLSSAGTGIFVCVYGYSISNSTLILAGLVGIVLTLILEIRYRYKRDRIALYNFKTNDFVKPKQDKNVDDGTKPAADS